MLLHFVRTPRAILTLKTIFQIKKQEKRPKTTKNDQKQHIDDTNRVEERNESGKKRRASLYIDFSASNFIA